MNPEDPKFKEIRHRFYRLAHHGPSLLREMGVVAGPEGPLPNDYIRQKLFDLADQGRLGELEPLIAKKEAEIMMLIGHEGDPCKFCGVPMIQLKPGPCPVRKQMVRW